MNIDNLSDVPLYAARPARYVPPKRKAATWIAVAIVHLLILSVLLLSQVFPSLSGRHGGAEHEAILDLSGSRPVNQPEVRMVLPTAPTGVPPEIQQAPPPPIIPPPTPDQPQLQEGGGAQQKGDLLGAVGRQIACSAGHYENLTEAQREHCERVPFAALQMPTGELRMLPPQGYNRFRPPPDTEPHISGGDAQRLQMERPSGCPAIMNTPCVNQIPGR